MAAFLSGERVGILSDPVDEVLSSRAKVRLLRVFSLEPEPMSAREAGRRIGLAKRSADLALRDLVRVGVIKRTGSGVQQMYVLNPHHALVRHALLMLFRGACGATSEGQGGEQGAIVELFDTLRDAVEVPEPSVVEWAVIFGSIAHGTDTPESDIDLGVIVTDDQCVEPMRERLAEMLPMVRRRFGRVLSPVVLTLDQARRLKEAGHHLIQAFAEGRVLSAKAADLGKVLHRKK